MLTLWVHVHSNPRNHAIKVSGEAFLLQESEEELVLAAQTGNSAAFERLLRQLERQMLSVAAGFAHTPDDANDIYQDAMLAAWRALPKFKLESKFSTWLYKIVVNTALSSRRKLKRTWLKLAAAQTEYLHEEQYYESESPQTTLLGKELSGHINRAMKKLTDSERIAFVLCH